MVVTDLTRMYGDRICVAGYLEKGGAPIRPVLEGANLTEAWLQPTPGGGVIVPFAVVDLDVGETPRGIGPPHTEDRIVPDFGHQLVKIATEGNRFSWLEWSVSPSICSMFGAEVQAPPDQRWGRYVKSGEGSRSLGTIRAQRLNELVFSQSPDTGKWEYRLRFTDATGEEFRLNIVALDFRQELRDLVADGLSVRDAASVTLANLRRQDVFLRIGLARHWDQFPDRCYLQVMGVYGFAP
jgi:hypothetical protein